MTGRSSALRNCASRSGERRRCAVYTRKSSEEGLEQDFNSLQAQREACEAYVMSQTGEGWSLIGTGYDDGGFSGGTLERPALARLLDDVRARRIDIVVVYKVDRLTRSLSDFARIVEVFDAHGVSFVSVTQAFNTTTSMGRLTLNMLLSFAQFEREVTGERIRDKIAASKRKGMWMGGTVPLGYEPDGRTLAINQAEAETVRTIFRLYLEHGTVRRVKEETDRLGLLTKHRRHPNGRTSGGRPMSRGYLYKLLGNPLYIGRIPHKGASYAGQHEPIIDQETWDAVQAGLKGNSHERLSAPRLTEPSPLIGKLFDADGHPLTPSHAVKNGRRYRYYVSRHLITGEAPTDAPAERAGWRLPAREIERIVSDAVDQLFTDRSKLASAARAAAWRVDQIPSLLDRMSVLTDTAINYVDKVTLEPAAVQITLSLAVASSHIGPQIETIVPVTIKRRGVEQRLVLHGAHRSNIAGHTDPALVKALHRAHRCFEDLASGRAVSVKAIATREGVSDRYVAHLLPLAFLSPRLIAAILVGEQPADLTLERLIHDIDIPLGWDDQHAQLGVN